MDGRRMPKKPMPVAERRRESGNTHSVSFIEVSV